MFEEKTDYELFAQYIKNPDANSDDKREALSQLWKRYEALTHKMGHVLEARRAKGNFYGLETDTYYTDFYDAFLKAVDGLQLSKIKTDPKTWKFWIQYNGYLRSANRDKINDYCRITKHERPITVTNEDGDEVSITDLCGTSYSDTIEDAFFRNEESIVLKEAIKNAYSKFSDKQKKIWSMRENGETFTAIAKSMSVSSSSIKYQMNRIKDVLKDELAVSNKRHMTDVNPTCLM
jgi:DNA-directed RNA polymerase specialized sigma24 family protein